MNDFDGTKWMDFKAIRRTDKNVVFGVAAAKQALADSGLEITDDNRDDIGVYLRLRRGRAVPAHGEPREVARPAARAPCRPFFIANMLPDTASGQIAIETGIRGPNMCIVTACSTGTHNIGEAAEGIRRGDFIAAIAGSTENPLHEVVYIGFSNMRGMGTPRDGRGRSRRCRGRSTAPATVSCWARASGALVLEDLEYAKARGATIYAEVVGYGSAADAWDLIQPVEKGDGVRRAMDPALERHGVPATRST